MSFYKCHNLRMIKFGANSLPFRPHLFQKIPFNGRHSAVTTYMSKNPTTI